MAKSFQGSDISTNTRLQADILERTGINPTKKLMVSIADDLEKGTFKMLVDSDPMSLTHNHLVIVKKDYLGVVSIIDLENTNGGIGS